METGNSGSGHDNAHRQIEFLGACANGDLDRVNAFLNSGTINPNTSHYVLSHKYDEDIQFVTPLLVACREGHLNIIEALLEARANPNGVNEKCVFPLIVAAYIGRADIIKCLVKANADPHKCCITNVSSHFNNYQMKHSCNVVEILLKAKANPNTAYKVGIGSHVDTVLTVTPLLAVICFTMDYRHANEHNTCIRWNGEGKTALHFASAYDNQDVVNALLEAGANPNACDSRGYTPLSVACLVVSDDATSSSTIKLLLQYGADLHINIQDGTKYVYSAMDAGFLEIDGATQGEAALYSAIARGFNEVVKILLAKVSPNIAYKNGKTPLILACNKRHTQVVLTLIEGGANLNLAEDDGSTPLIAACHSDNVSIVSDLLNAGADITRVNKDGITSLIAACTQGHADIINTLLKAGADFTLSDNSGRTPLIAASEHGHHKAMSMLLESGADPNIVDNNGRTALRAAIECRHGIASVQAVSILLKAGADPNIADHNGTTPLIAACAYNNNAIITYLLEAGVNPNITNHSGTTPLIAACSNADKHSDHINNTVFTLLKHNADPNKSDSEGQTPLIALAASLWSNHVDSISTLLQGGANPNIADNNGRTPLIAACSRHNSDAVISTLLGAGADINKADNKGITPLIAALLNGIKAIAIQLLYQPNCNINHSTEDGSTALAVATHHSRYYANYVDIIESLHAKGAIIHHNELSRSIQEHSHDNDSIYNEAVTKSMSEGFVDIKVSLIALHGSPGVGKTSLKRLLLGELPLPPELQNSTPIMDQPARAITSSKVGCLMKTGSEQLERINENVLLELLAGYVQDQLTQVGENKFSSLLISILNKLSRLLYKGMVADTGGSSSGREIPYSEISDFSSCISATPTCNSHDQHATLAESTILKDLVEYMKMMNRQSNVIGSSLPQRNIFDMHWFHIIDSGGQPQFQDVLHVPFLFRAQSLHIVVIRLNERLDDKPKFRYIRKGEEVGCLPVHLALTNLQIIERTCQLAQASGSRQPPWVMVVGTHLDLIDDCDETLEEKNQRLKMLQEEYSDVIVTKSKEEVIFSLNAMVEDEAQRQQYRDELQQMIINAPVVKEKFPVPVRWLVLDMEVSRMSTDGIISIEHYYKIAKNLGMTEKETDTALKYFTDVGIHLHYLKAIPHIVFTQMMPVVDRLSTLISVSFTHSKFGPAGDRKKLKEKGLFSKKDLNKFCKVDESGQFTNDDFLKLLQYLHIAVHVSDDDYFLPCALPLSDASQSFIESPSCDPIVFSWDKKILPHGFFPTLVVNLLQQKYFALPKMHVEQKRHRAYLKESQIPGEIIIPGGICLVDATQWIELHYYGENCTQCPALRINIENSISEVSKILHLPHMATPQLGFICNGLICDVFEARHICTVTKGTPDKINVTCSIGMNTNTVDKERKLCWLIPQDFIGKNDLTHNFICIIITSIKSKLLFTFASMQWYWC